MKKLLQHTYLLGSILIFCLSCNQEEDQIHTDQESLQQGKEQVVVQLQIDKITSDLEILGENSFIDEETSAKKNNTGTKLKTTNATCYEQTSIIVDNYKQITLDFAEGCTNWQGNLLKGKLIIQYLHADRQKNEILLTYSLDNFYFNGKKIEGSISDLISFENSNGNPQSKINRDIKIIWDAENYVWQEAEIVREWIDGTGTLELQDNIYSLTGNSTIIEKDGAKNFAKITKPLLVALSCNYVSQGIVNFSNPNYEFDLDFGNGTCDAVGMLKFGKNNFEIKLQGYQK